MSRGRKENSSRSKMIIIESNVTGVVKRYIESGGYGFITEDDTNRDVFFHISAVSYLRPDDPIRVGDEVIYDLYLAPKGYRAESVHILNQDGSDSDDTYYDNRHRRKNSGIGWSRQGEGEESRRGRRSWHDARDRNHRAENVGRGYGRRDEGDYESDDDWRVPSRDRIPRSHIRSANGSTLRTRSASRRRKKECQGRQTGVGKDEAVFLFSGIGWSREREGEGERAENRRPQPRQRDGRGRNYRAESVGRGYGRRDEGDYESDDDWRVPSRDRIPRSRIRSANGSTSRTRSASRRRNLECQGGQTGVENDELFFCRSCQFFHDSKKMNCAHNRNRRGNYYGNGEEITDINMLTFEERRRLFQIRRLEDEHLQTRALLI